MTLGGMVNEWTSRLSKTWDRPSWWNIFIVTPYVLLVVFLLSSGIDKAVVDRQQTTSGVITKSEPEDHARYQYKFTVRGESHIGYKSAMKGKYRIGQQVVVFYDPEHPTINKLTSFANSEPIIGPVFFCTVGIVGVAVLIFVARRRSLRPDTKRSLLTVL